MVRDEVERLPDELRLSKSADWYFSLTMLWLDTVGWAIEVPSWKSRVLVCWWWQFYWSFAHLTAPVVTFSIILNSNNIQNGDLVPAYPGCPGKWALKVCYLLPSKTVAYVGYGRCSSITAGQQGIYSYVLTVAQDTDAQHVSLSC